MNKIVSEINLYRIMRGSPKKVYFVSQYLLRGVRCSSYRKCNASGTYYNVFTIDVSVSKDAVVFDDEIDSAHPS